MKAAAQWLSDWKHGLVALGFAGLALLAAIFVPDERWVKLGHLIAGIAANPAGALAFVSLVAGAVTTLRGAWMRVPPALVLLVALGVAASGCGASALSQHGSGVAIAMLAVRGAADAADAERDASEAQCHDEACLHSVIDARAPVVAAIDTARDAVNTWRDAVEVALEADSDSPDLLALLVTAAARVVARWRDLVAALSGVGVTLPSLPASLDALGGQ